MFLKHRVEALSDAVFAIAMTLLILDIKVPLGSEGPLGPALAKDAHGWISFAISFLLAGVFWMHQHKVFELASAWNKANLLLTFVFLAFVSTLPFSTSLWGHHLHDPLALMIYFGNQCVLAVVLSVQVAVLMANQHVTADGPLAEVRLTVAGLAIAFAAAVVTARLAVQYVWVPPMVLLVITRLLRRRVRARAVHP